MKTLHPNPNWVKSQAVKLERYDLGIFAASDPEPHIIRFYWLDPDTKSASGGGPLEASYYKKHPNLRNRFRIDASDVRTPPGSTGTTIVYENIDIRKGSSLEFSIDIDEGV